MTKLQIEYHAQKEVERANRAKEAELNRHNLEMEKQGWQTITSQAQHIQNQKELGSGNLAELNRANLANESIRWFDASNQNAYRMGSLANEQQKTHNQVLQFADTLVQNRQIAEDRLIADYALRHEANAETRRANQQRELLTSQSQAETARHNQESERLNQAAINAGMINTAVSAGSNLIGSLSRAAAAGKMK